MCIFGIKMMHKKLFLIVVIGFFIFHNNIQAQFYKTGIGIRGALFFSGLTVKHFIGEKAAIEGIIGERWGGVKITALYEMHNHLPFGKIDRFTWFFGGGAHIGFFKKDNPPWWDNKESYTIIGIDGIIGMEFTFEYIPISISLDYKPLIDLNYGYFGFREVALSVRYVF